MRAHKLKAENREKLWTTSFLILWQSQLVSTVGDAVYSIALGFWVLEVTGSTALMGALMAASTLPGVLVSPFAGVLIDRTNKKRLFILMDFIRACCIILLASAAYRGLIGIWMVFAAGVLLSVCGAVFSPGIQSTVPDLVPKSKIANANSAFLIVTSGSNLLGNVAGGFLYQTLGAPLLFLINGISFLFSGASLPFVKISNNERHEEFHFFKDMADGFKYMQRQSGLRFILIIIALSNFFSFIAIVLFLPLCKYTPSLGAKSYGIAMACFMGGSMLGFLLLSIVSVKPANKLKILMLSYFTSDILFVIAVNQPLFIVMAVLLAFAGFFNAVVNVILISTVQASTPQDLRGKVMSFISMITSGLTPFAMALGGVLGEIFPIRLVISAAFIAGILVGIPSCFSKPFREYITTDYVTNTVQDILQE